MKSLQTIANEATSKDWYIVAEIADCSDKNVRNVIKKDKPDNYNIQKIFSEYLEMKEEFQSEAKNILIEKYRKQKTRKKKRRE